MKERNGVRNQRTEREDKPTLDKFRKRDRLYDHCFIKIYLFLFLSIGSESKPLPGLSLAVNVNEVVKFGTGEHVCLLYSFVGA